VPGFQHVESHRSAHVAEANEADTHAVSSSPPG
jgi:hypothetical protein